MTQYKLIESNEAKLAIEKMKETIKLLQRQIELLRSGGSISLDKISPMEDMKKTREKKPRMFGKGLRLSDAIFQAIETSEPFSLRDALDAVKKKFNWDAPQRAIDSVRGALNKEINKLFIKVDNKYQKIK